MSTFVKIEVCGGSDCYHNEADTKGPAYVNVNSILYINIDEKNKVTRVELDSIIFYTMESPEELIHRIKLAQRYSDNPA